mgnify:CR=1 FL=1|tara:strand:- start:15756 stop:17954 length:2199 start_codon:yes stop_codon:yes gene_type:complete
MITKNKKISIIYLSFFFFLSPIFAQNNETSNYSQNVYGGIGLIQTPTARFDADGEFGFGLSIEDPYNRLYGRVQYFPWLEAVLRYTELGYASYFGGSYSGAGDQTFKDKAIDVKFKIFEEGDYRPAVALGLIDLGGTGVFSSEYIVANKNIGNFDLSLGIGWGRMGTRDNIKNPLSMISESFEFRQGSMSGRGGQLEFDDWFRGETAIFGGMTYQTPIKNLKFMLEYDSNNYQQEKDGVILEVDSPINYSLSYSRMMSERSNLDISLGFNRGNTIYSNFTVHTNLNFLTEPQFRLGPENIPLNPWKKDFKNFNEKQQKYIRDQILSNMKRVGLVTHEILFNGKEIQAEISQGRFRKQIDVIDLASRILAINSPSYIEYITIVNFDMGLETFRSTIKKDELINKVMSRGLYESDFTFNQSRPIMENAIRLKNPDLYPDFFWELKPHLSGTIQHQQRFYFWQLEAYLHTEYAIKRGMYLTADIGFNIKNNFDEYTYHIPDGELYHVRQDRRLYLTEGETGIRKMALEYTFPVSSNIKARLSAGYLEWMFGGVGADFLYMPDDANWALEFDTYWLKQREFNQRLGFKDYETVTAFMTYYYRVPFYDLTLKVSGGKFLAKDVGFQIDIGRRFKTGAKVGAIIALTDCDAECVGEGSFNKWIYFNLPMDMFGQETRGRGAWAWSPLTKDAGQKAHVGNLYDVSVNSIEEIDLLRRKPWSVKKLFSGFGTSPKGNGQG